MSSQLLCLIKGNSIGLHVDGTGLAAAHPADWRAVEGGPAAHVVLEHHGRFRFWLGRLGFWQLEFHELFGLVEAAVGHGTPGEGGEG